MSRGENTYNCCRWISNGILRDRALAQVWKTYSPRIHNSLFLLLKQFGVLYELEEVDAEHVLDILHKMYDTSWTTLTTLASRDITHSKTL